jgi:hypothetical protein
VHCHSFLGVQDEVLAEHAAIPLVALGLALLAARVWSSPPICWVTRPRIISALRSALSKFTLRERNGCSL